MTDQNICVECGNELLTKDTLENQVCEDCDDQY